MVTLAGYAVVTLLITLPVLRHLRRDAAATLVALALIPPMPIAQVARDSRRTYPFDHWGMYSSATPPRTYFEFLVEYQHGAIAPYPTGDLGFVSPGPLQGYSALAPLTMRLLQLRAACRCSGGDERLDAVIRALMNIRERRSRMRVAGFTMHQSTVTRSAAAPERSLLYRWRSKQTP